MTYRRRMKWLTAVLVLLTIGGALAITAGSTYASGSHSSISARCTPGTPRCLCPPGTTNPKYCSLCPAGFVANQKTHSCLKLHVCHTVSGKPIRYTGSKKPLACLKPPKAITGPPKHIGRHSASVTGSVNPRGLPTRWYIRWGVCPALNHTTKTHQIGPTMTVSVSGFLPHLKAGVRYCYQVVATNKKGTSMGRVRSFRIPLAPRPPNVQNTPPAHHITKHSAVVGGRVNPHQVPNTRYWIVYGRGASCTNLNHRTPTQTTSVPVSFPATLRHLAPGTTYCYRVIAINHVGEAKSRTRLFHTPSPSRPPKKGKPPGFTG
jgi:hypothetical protein